MKMKSMHNKMSLTIFCTLLSIGGSIIGYDYTFNNKTNKILMCGVKFVGASGKRFWVLLGPEQSHTMTFGPLCYSSIQVTEYDPQKAVEEGYYKGGVRFKDERLGLDPEQGGTPGGEMGLTAEYGDNSPEYVKEYFDRKIWHVPSIIYAKSAFDADKITDAVEEIGRSAENVAKLAAAAKTGGTAAAVAKSMDLKLGKLLGSMTKLVVEGVKYGSCRGHTLDIYGIEVPMPKSRKKENTYIFVSREN